MRGRRHVLDEGVVDQYDSDRAAKEDALKIAKAKVKDLEDYIAIIWGSGHIVKETHNLSHEERLRKALEE